MSRGGERSVSSAARWLAGIFVTGLALRLAFVWSAVFVGGTVRFQSNDPWYHVRFIENLAAHFPRAISVDPFLILPGLAPVPIAPGLDLLVAGIALILGGGHPSAHLLYVVAALVPPILGSLVVIAIFIAAIEVTSVEGALFAAALAVLLPGQFLQRTVLGFTDHHVCEAVFATLTVALLMRALSRREGWTAAAAGCALAAYSVSWGSALMGIGILALAAGCAIASSSREERAPAARLFTIAFGVAAALVLPFIAIDPAARLQTGVLAMCCSAAAIVTLLTSRTLTHAVGRVAALVGAAAVILAALFEQHSLRSFAQTNLGRIELFTADVHVTEAAPLWAGNPLSILWNESGVVWIAALAGFILLWRRWRRQREAYVAVLIVWSAALAVAMVLQLRFSYYVSLCTAVLAAYAMREAYIASRSRSLRKVVFGACAFLLLTAAGLAVPAAGRYSGPDSAWIEALEWMRRATPEPFDSPSFYYDDYRAGSPPARYAVMAWWDFGYWISTIAHRVPVDNPTQRGATTAARFFLSTDDAVAAKMADAARAEYIVVDDFFTVSAREPVTPAGFEALCAWSRVPIGRFMEKYERSQPDGTTQTVYLFYPDYFRSTAVRLSLLGGGAAERPVYRVVTFRPAPESDASPRILALDAFPTYAAAERAVATAPAHNRRIVSVHPNEPCIPVPAMTSFERVFGSAEKSGVTGEPRVEVFRRRH